MATTGEFELLHAGAAPAEISILMPLFRQAAFVSEAIASVLGQSDVTAEILVSDDASDDGTFEVARVALLNGAHGHRVLLRHGARRLRRDHLHVMAAHAGCDLLMQAHGDDVSVPHRARRVIDVFTATGTAAVLSTSDQIDENGRLLSAATPLGDDLVHHTVTDLTDRPAWIVGGSMAWRRSALAPFEPLTARSLPVAHDVAMVWRAALAGGVVAVSEPLVKRRIHDSNWSRRLADGVRPEAAAFTSGLYLAAIADQLRADVETAREAGMIGEEVAAELDAIVAGRSARATDRVRSAFAELVAEGLQPTWVPEEQVQADLGSALARWARRGGPAQRLAVNLHRRWSRRRHGR